MSVLRFTSTVALIGPPFAWFARSVVGAQLIRCHDRSGSTNRFDPSCEPGGMVRRRLAIQALRAGIAAVVLLFHGVLSRRPHTNPLAVPAANAGVTPEQAEAGRGFGEFSTGDD